MEDYETWKKVGKIAAEALEYGRKLIKPGASMKEVCDKIDQKIISLGAKPAWPTQIGNNEIAAHYTPDPDDDSVFKDELVCLDVGAHIDGFVGDNATTVDLSGKYSDMIKAAKEAVEAASKVLGVGVEISEIGKVIQETIMSYDYRPIRNLTGHAITQWDIHARPTIPNIEAKGLGTLEENQIIAIEPFVTNGKGMIFEQNKGNIFSFVERKPVRSQYAREALKFIEEEYYTMPFTTRWLSAKFGQGKASLALRDLLNTGSIHAHPPLVEKDRGMVAQHEHTFLIKDKVERLTK